MTQASDPTRLDRLEALAETTLLVIHDLSNRQDRTQNQLDQLQQRVNDIAQRQVATGHAAA